MRIRPLLAAAAISACALAAPARPLGAQATPATTPARLPITVERHAEGAPLTLGVPFPKGALQSPDQVRVLTPDGREVPTQVTEVSTWEPADPSLKWIWVFFFAGQGEHYILEYGPGVRRSRDHASLDVVNNQRAGGLLEVTTGPMRFVVQQGDTGFLKSVALDLDGNGFDAADVVAEGPPGRRLRPPTGRGQGGARAVSPLLGDGGQAAAFGSPRRPGWSPTHGLRIFGWTHAYTLPYALAILQPNPSTPAAAAGASTRK